MISNSDSEMLTTQETLQKMLETSNGDKKWREKMMEGEDDGRVKTIECLRGRLLAERVASKAAKEDAEFMGNKLIMLEQQLKSEIESRNKAEKKLKYLMKRMESLKLTPVVDHFSISSSSSTISSVFQESEEKNLGSRTTDYLKRSSSSEKDMTDSLTSQSSGCDESEFSSQTLSIEENSSSVSTAHSCKNSKHPSEEELSKAEDRLKEELTINDLRQTSTGEKESSKPQMIMDNVGDLVAGLGHAKEQIRSSIGKREIKFSHSVKLCSNT